MAGEQTGEFVCMAVVIEEQTQEPAVYVKSDHRANSKTSRGMHYGPYSMYYYYVCFFMQNLDLTENFSVFVRQ